MTDAKPTERPGWAQLRRAADELHAAELLIGDPLAPSRTAVPHLRAFWVEMIAAGLAAKLATASEPEAWLRSCEVPGLDAKARGALIEHHKAIHASEVTDDKLLRAHARAARALLSLVEPIIGGVALYNQRRRAMLAAVGVAIVVLPFLTYGALKVEVPGSGPWRATYFSDRKLEDQSKVMRELDINHDWTKDAPFEDLPPDKFSVRWDTCLRLDDAKSVIFQVHANDGARVYVNGETAIDAWEKSPETRKRGFGSVELPLESGVHHLRIEYFESLGDASIKFAASFDGEMPITIPNELLSYPGDDLDQDDPCAAVR